MQHLNIVQITTITQQHRFTNQIILLGMLLVHVGLVYIVGLHKETMIALCIIEI